MNILFICTHNRCRSILAEAIMRQSVKKYANNTIIVKSAGSAPVGKVHPLTLKHLKHHGYNTENLNSTSWDDISDFKPDVTITVCDNAAKEVCPLYLGHTVKVHWGLSDPSKTKIDEDNRQAAFDLVINILEKRIKQVCQCNFTNMTDEQINNTFNKIGEMTHGCF
jgi:arsenate reductase